MMFTWINDWFGNHKGVNLYIYTNTEWMNALLAPHRFNCLFGARMALTHIHFGNPYTFWHHTDEMFIHAWMYIHRLLNAQIHGLTFDSGQPHVSLLQSCCFFYVYTVHDHMFYFQWIVTCGYGLRIGNYGDGAHDDGTLMYIMNLLYVVQYWSTTQMCWILNLSNTPFTTFEEKYKACFWVFLSALWTTEHVRTTVPFWGQRSYECITRQVFGEEYIKLKLPPKIAKKSKKFGILFDESQWSMGWSVCVWWVEGTKGSIHTSPYLHWY